LGGFNIDNKFTVEYNPICIYPNYNDNVKHLDIIRFKWSCNYEQFVYQLKIWDLNNLLIYDSGVVLSGDKYEDVLTNCFKSGCVYKWKILSNSKHNNIDGVFIM